MTCLADAVSLPVSSQPEFVRYLHRPVTLTWRRAPIHRSLSRLGGLYQIAVVIDRRIDPTTELNLSVQDSSFLRVVAAAAVQSGKHVELIGPCVYVGPREPTRFGSLLVEIANQKVATLPPRIRKKWQARRAVNFSRLDEPRKVVEQVGAGRGIELVNPKQLPHDLWPAQRWPQLTMVETLTLSLLGFDMTFDVTSSGACRIRPIDRSARVEHVHRISLDGEQRSALVSKFPKAELTEKGVSLTATLASHADLREWLRKTREADIGVGAERDEARRVEPTGPRSYSIQIKNQPLKPIVTGVANRMNLKVQFDTSIPNETLQQRISFQIANGTREDLIAAMLSETGLRFSIDGRTLRISAAGR